MDFLHERHIQIVALLFNESVASTAINNDVTSNIERADMTVSRFVRILIYRNSCSPVGNEVLFVLPRQTVYAIPWGLFWSVLPSFFLEINNKVTFRQRINFSPLHYIHYSIHGELIRK